MESDNASKSDNSQSTMKHKELDEIKSVIDDTEIKEELEEGEIPPEMEIPQEEIKPLEPRPRLDVEMQHSNQYNDHHSRRKRVSKDSTRYRYEYMPRSSSRFLDSSYRSHSKSRNGMDSIPKTRREATSSLFKNSAGYKTNIKPNAYDKKSSSRSSNHSEHNRRYDSHRNSRRSTQSVQRARPLGNSSKFAADKPRGPKTPEIHRPTSTASSSGSE